MQFIEGDTVANDAKIAIVVARFNNFINKNLLEGTVDTLTRIGQVQNKNLTIVRVPGAYESLLTTHLLANSKKYNGIIVLGTIIRGQTLHFELIAKECSSYLISVSIKTQIPVSFGILVTETIEQAIERAGTKYGNKGIEAALTILEMINVIKHICSN